MTSRAEATRPVCDAFHATKDHANESQFVDTFVYEIGREEKDLAKRQKIDDLRLSDDEWARVQLFNDLLAVRPVASDLQLY